MNLQTTIFHYFNLVLLIANTIVALYYANVSGLDEPLLHIFAGVILLPSMLHHLFPIMSNFFLVRWLLNIFLAASLYLGFIMSFFIMSAFQDLDESLIPILTFLCLLSLVAPSFSLLLLINFGETTQEKDVFMVSNYSQEGLIHQVRTQQTGTYKEGEYFNTMI
mmetsp:Transcript_21568/g.19132  ORF Transcript_21568/g.19132 Transcript_21568/m.19132 type:complete len:164 (+) Transcript_21568:2-493(+)